MQRLLITLTILLLCRSIQAADPQTQPSAADAEVAAAYIKMGIAWKPPEGLPRRTLRETETSVSVFNFSPPAEDGKSHVILIASSDDLDESALKMSVEEWVKQNFEMYKALTYGKFQPVKLLGSVGVRVRIENNNAVEGAMALKVDLYAVKVGSTMKMFHLMQIDRDDPKLVAAFDRAASSATRVDLPSTK